MKAALRDYQQELYTGIREGVARHRAVCAQLATGGGKTVIFTAIADAVFSRKKRIWVVVPRRELLEQASKHLTKWSIPHGRIDAKSEESRAYSVHVVSKDTLLRRIDRIKNWPDILIFDESHLFLDGQHKIFSALPDTTKIIGFTATPERMDGRGLSSKSGGIYDVLVQGPSIPWLQERGFLCPMRYFSPPLDGLESLKTRGTEYDEEELESLLQRKKIYGDLVGHYERHGVGRAALIFCRSVKSAYHAAERFRENGHNFVAIDGTMSGREITRILDRHRSGDIQGICNCQLVTYGVDIPRVEYIGDISPTLSKNLYMQKIGRGLRPHDGKTDLIYMDHVNQILTHQEDDFPGVPLHFVPEITWNFDGVKKRKKNKTANIKLCPHLDYFYCPKPSCANCDHNPDAGNMVDQRKPMVVIPAELVELKKPIPLNQRLPEERREIQDQIGAAALEYKTGETKSAIEKLLEIADSLGYKDLWVYHRLTDENRYTVDVTLLAAIARIRGYKPGWVHYARKKINRSA